MSPLLCWREIVVAAVVWMMVVRLLCVIESFCWCAEERKNGLQGERSWWSLTKAWRRRAIGSWLPFVLPSLRPTFLKASRNNYRRVTLGVAVKRVRRHQLLCCLSGDFVLFQEERRNGNEEWNEEKEQRRRWRWE